MSFSTLAKPDLDDNGAQIQSEGSPSQRKRLGTIFASVASYVSSSLARKFVLAVIIVNTLLIATGGIELVQRDRAMNVQARMTRAEGMSRLLATSAASAITRQDFTELERLGDAATQIPFVNYVQFHGANEQILYDSRQRSETRITVDTTAFENLGRGRNTAYTFVSDAAVFGRAPFQFGNGQTGHVTVSVSRTDAAASNSIPVATLAYGVALILVGGLIAFLTARSVSGRLAKLANVAKRFRLGERAARVEDRALDEVGVVARGINAMLDTIAASERSLNEVFRVARIGAWRYAPSNPHPEFSETVQEILGLVNRAEPRTAESFLGALPPEKKNALTALLTSGDPGATFHFTSSVTRSDGSRGTCWVEARSEIDSITGERVLVGVCQDITEREHEAAQLRQAQKMEAVGQLTGGLAHDFNNLLAIIVGNLDLLEEDPQLDSDARESLEAALSAAWRGAELTRQLLAFSRRQTLTPQVIDLNSLISDMASLWRRTLGEAIDVRLGLNDGLWATMADQAQVESALLNLVINARDAMPGGGTLTVESGNMSVDEGGWFEGEEDTIPAGDYVVITVSDTGSGMPPDVISRAFEPFFTTKNVGEGSGLGLSMILGFAQQSGGTVRIYSEVGRGTSVRLFLPRAKESFEEAVVEPAGAEIPFGTNETVLLVEDNDGVLRVAARMLKELKYSVVTARDGPEALNILEGDTHLDLLFTDIVMPGGIDGFELGKRATTLRPSIKVLHTSGFTRPSEHVDSRILSEPPLAKPYRKVDLARRLRQLLDDAG